jgi:hypothetical protein
MRSIPDPGFAGDDGAVDPAVAAALEAYDGASEPEQSAQHHATLSVLQDARVLVPVVAVLGEVEHDVPPGGRARSRLARDKTSDMAAVLLTGRDGRTALLAFTGTASLSRWDPRARPVPVTLRQAAQAALQDQASALVVDVAGPVLFVVEEEDLASLARGHRLVGLEDGRWGWAQAGPT